MIKVDVYNLRGERCQSVDTEAVVLVNSNGEDEFDYSASEYDVVYVNMNNVMMVHVVEDREDDATSEDAGRVSEGASEEETPSVSSVGFAPIIRRFLGNALQMQSPARS